MAQHITSRTIHTIHIDVQDDVLARIDAGADEVDVVLVSRTGNTAPKRLTYRDIQRLLGATEVTMPRPRR